MTLTKKEKIIFYYLTRGILKKRKPLGSKYLAKIIKNKLSPSTLRIYLRRIAKAGYLEPENCFSGRIPTEKGWYYYLENYQLKPEINFPELEEKKLEKLLAQISNFTKNIVFYKDKELLIKGLTNVVDFWENKELAKELLSLSEKIEEIIKSLDKEINILIGSKLKDFGASCSSLIIYKSEDKFFGFLGPKINYYHTNLILMKKIMQKLNNE